MLGQEADASHELRTPISVIRANAERPGENLARRVNTASETLSRTPIELFRPSS
jgi:signal transduction histidine kinase